MADAALRVESLRAAMARALVRSVRPGAEFLPDASALVTGLVDGSRWSLAGDGTVAGAGAGIIGTLRSTGADERHLILDAEDPVVRAVAGRLATLAEPPNLWRVVGAELEPVGVPALGDAIAAAGPPLEVDAPVPARLRGLAEALGSVGAGAEVRLERDHPGWILSVRGLEVGRVAEGSDSRAPEIELGVGRFDRDAHVEVSGPRPLVEGSLPGHLEAIGRVAADVVARRRADGPPHPARTLRAERWLRERLLADPTLAGLDPAWRGRRLASPVGPSALTDWSIAPLLGEGELVVAAVGVHPDLVWSAAHAWLQAASLGSPARLRIAVPARDASVGALATWVAALRPELGAEVAAVPDDWMAGAAGPPSDGRPVPGA